MVYHSMPQRSARSITANTNHPPQDPPGPLIHIQFEEMATQSQIDRVEKLDLQISLLMAKYGVSI